MRSLPKIVKIKLLAYSSVILILIGVGSILFFRTKVLSESSRNQFSKQTQMPDMSNRPEAFANLQQNTNQQPSNTETKSSTSPTPKNTVTPSVSATQPTAEQTQPTRTQPTSTPTPTPTSIPVKPAQNEGTTISTFVTYYGWADNTPPGTDIAFPGQPNTIHTAAGGTGTYDDPITMASDPNVWSVGTKMYLPYIKKYVIMEDICGGCTNNKNTGKYHIDIWMNSDSRNTDKLLDCENFYTRQSVQAEINPPADREVDNTPLFDPVTGICLGK